MFGLDCGHVDVDIIFERLDVLTDVHVGTVDDVVDVYEVVGAAGA